MNWQDWLQITAARLRTPNSAFKPLPIQVPQHPQLMELPIQTLLQGAGHNIEQQLHAFYCEF
jgi:hypothetical protein